MRALAGLGNQGDGYAGHRHNVGWMLLDVLERRHAIVDKKDLDLVRLTHIRLHGRGKNVESSGLWLMRSKTYMNENGLGVAKGCKELDLRPEQILVAFDDVDLPLGKLRLRESGGSSGEKGMQSIIGALGTQKIPRLRMGISGEKASTDTVAYVLSSFEKNEKDTAAEMVEEAADAVEMVLRSGLIAAMNRFN